jgi:hypothetical protein
MAQTNTNEISAFDEKILDELFFDVVVTVVVVFGNKSPVLQ